MRTDGHDGQIRSVNGLTLSTPTSELADVTCENSRIPAKLTPDGWFSLDIVGELCWRGELSGKTFVLVGDNDIIGCSGELDCNDHTAFVANEKEAYSDPVTCVEPVCVVSYFHPCRQLPLLCVYLLQLPGQRKGEMARRWSGWSAPCLPGSSASIKADVAGKAGLTSERKAVGYSELLDAVEDQFCAWKLVA